MKNVLLERGQQGVYSSEMLMLYKKDKGRLWKCSTLKRPKRHDNTIPTLDRIDLSSSLLLDSHMKNNISLLRLFAVSTFHCSFNQYLLAFYFGKVFRVSSYKFIVKITSHFTEAEAM